MRIISFRLVASALMDLHYALYVTVMALTDTVPAAAKGPISFL